MNVPGIALARWCLLKRRSADASNLETRLDPTSLTPRKMTLAGCRVAGGNGDETGAHDCRICWRRVVGANRRREFQKGFRSLLLLLSRRFF
jgi:hypothetical protein